MNRKNRKLKIAVVEDEDAIQRVLAEWLMLEGYEAIRITTGREAVEVIPRELPDLILLDLILPELNGFEVMIELSKNPKTRSIPVVVITNLGDEEDRKRAIALGARNYLVKAEYDFSAIKNVINSALKSP